MNAPRLFSTTWLFLFGIALSGTTLLAAPPNGGRVLFLDVAGQQIQVALPGEHPRYLLDPRTGDRLVRFTMEEANLVTRALAERGLEERAFDVLLGLQYGRPGMQEVLGDQQADDTVGLLPAFDSLTRKPGHLRLEVAGEVFDVSLQGGGPSYAIDPLSGQRFVQFSLDDARTISRMLAERGYDASTILSVLSNLRAGDSASGGPTISPERERKKLNPGCGQCLTGSLCSRNDPTAGCCQGGGGCEACKVCG
jgi:hypothetical protein